MTDRIITVLRTPTLQQFVTAAREEVKACQKHRPRLKRQNIETCGKTSRRHMAIKHLKRRHEVRHLRNICVTEPPAITSLIDYPKVDAVLQSAALMPRRFNRHRIRAFTHTKRNTVTLQLGWLFTDRRSEERIEHVTARARTAEQVIIVYPDHDVMGVYQPPRIFKRPWTAADDSYTFTLEPLAYLSTRQEANRLLL